MQKYGYQLEFISRIKRDGSGTEKVPTKEREMNQERLYNVACLSMTEKTYIAIGFNSFVVKLRTNTN